MIKAIRASDIPEMDTSYFRPWTLDMIYQVEPELQKIAAEAVAKKRQEFYDRLDAYSTAKAKSYKLVGWYARDPRLRSSAAWDCFFRYILKELKL